MASKGRRRKPSRKSVTVRKQKRRTTYKNVGKETRKQITRMSKFMPSLSKLKGKTRVTSAEYSQITKARRALRHTENLKPVTPKQAKILKKKGLLAGHGLQAIRLRNTAPNARIHVHKDGVLVSSNGRKFEYHPVTPDIDALAEAGERLLDRDDVILIFLWTTRGRTNEGFEDLEEWIEYLNSRFAQYHQIQDFTVGIVAEIRKAKKRKRV